MHAKTSKQNNSVKVSDGNFRPSPHIRGGTQKMYHLWTKPMDPFVDPVHGLSLWTTPNFHR